MSTSHKDALAALVAAEQPPPPPSGTQASESGATSAQSPPVEQPTAHLLAKAGQPATRVAVPAEVPVYKVTDDEWKKLSIKVRDEIPKIGVLSSVGASSDVWTDAELTKYPGWILATVPQDQLVADSLSVLKALQAGVSLKSVALITRLAWNLPSVTDVKTPVYTVAPFINISDVDIKDLPDSIDFEGGDVDFVRGDIPDLELVRATCFLCASLLRLFSKEVSSYILAYDRHIKDAYYKFYRTKFPLEIFKPNKGALEGVKNIMNVIPRCKGALARFLYHLSDVSEADKELCAILFEQHLGLTGMHAVGLFLRVCYTMKVPVEDLVAFCWHIQTKEALKCIAKIISEYDQLGGKDPAAVIQGTWRYSRVFKQSQFAAV